MRHLPAPVKTDDGTITDVVDTVTWSGGTIAPGQFDTFSLSVGPLPKDKAELAFPALQTYSNGEVVSWIDVAPASGPEPQHPRPLLHLIDSSTAATTPSPAAKTSSSDNGKGIAVAGLIVALIALGAAGTNLVTSRRERGPNHLDPRAGTGAASMTLRSPPAGGSGLLGLGPDVGELLVGERRCPGTDRLRR